MKPATSRALPPRALLRALRRAVGKANVIEAQAHRRMFGYDASPHWAIPDIVVLPTSAQQIAEVVRAANRFGVPFVARGAGTNLSGGSVPERGGISIVLTRMNRILEVDPDNRRAAVEPGVVNLDLQRALAPHGLRFVPDPASQRASTIGGNIAENAGGPHCLKYGVTTNHIGGLEVVLPDGSTLRVGSTVADPPGYDLMGVLTGSEGTMGIVTGATLRLSRRPPAVRTMLAAFDSVEAAGEAVSAIIAAGIVPAALEIMDRVFIEAVQASMDAGYSTDAEAVLIIELEGRPEGMDRRAGQIAEFCRDAGAAQVHTAATEDERERLWAGRHASAGALARVGSTFLVSDAVVPRARLAEILGKIREIGREYGFTIGNVFHAGDGNLHPNIFYDRGDPEQPRRAHQASLEIMRACAEMGGTISGEHGIGLEKMDAMGFVFSAQDLSLMCDVKAVFDPKGLANPGKVLPAETQPGALLAPRVLPPEKGLAAELMTVSDAEDAEQVAPCPVFHPRRAQNVREIMRSAQADHTAVVPIGGMTMVHRDELPEPSDAEWATVRISTSKFRRVMEHDAANLTVIAEAGVPLAALNARLAEGGQMVALDPPLRGQATVGGIIAACASGPGRLLYGTPRDLTLGIQAVLGDGRIVRMGGKAVKNVAGYDLTKLFVGSLGTLGVITQATLRTHPIPEARATLVGRFDTARDAAQWAKATLASDLVPSRLEILGGEAAASAGPQHAGGWVALLEIEGDADAVRAQAQEAAREPVPMTAMEADDASALWHHVCDLPATWEGMALKACLPIARAAETVEAFVLAASREAVAQGVVWHAGSGVAYLLARSDEEDRYLVLIDAVRDAAQAVGGHVVLERAPPGVKRAKGVWGREVPGLDLMRRIKRALDPDGVLIPGRFVGGI